MIGHRKLSCRSTYQFVSVVTAERKLADIVLCAALGYHYVALDYCRAYFIAFAVRLIISMYYHFVFSFASQYRYIKRIAIGVAKQLFSPLHRYVLGDYLPIFCPINTAFVRRRIAYIRQDIILTVACTCKTYILYCDSKPISHFSVRVVSAVRYLQVVRHTLQDHFLQLSVKFQRAVAFPLDFRQVKLSFIYRPIYLKLSRVYSTDKRRFDIHFCSVRTCISLSLVCVAIVAVRSVYRIIIQCQHIGIDFPYVFNAVVCQAFSKRNARRASCIVLIYLGAVRQSPIHLHRSCRRLDCQRRLCRRYQYIITVLLVGLICQFRMQLIRCSNVQCRQTKRKLICAVACHYVGRNQKLTASTFRHGIDIDFDALSA